MARAVLLATLLIAAVATAPASAEVGPRTVRLDTPAPPSGTTRVATTARFVFFATPRARGVARQLAKHAEAVRTRIADDLGRDYPGRTEVRVADGEESFQALMPSGLHAPSWAAGIAMPALDLVVINAPGGPRGDTPEQILAHEVSHLALGRLAPGRFPRWFLEGMATYHSGAFDIGRAAILAQAVASGRIIPLDDLTRGWPEDPADVQVAYAQSINFVSWLFRTHGREAVHRLVRGVINGQSFSDALEFATSTPLWKLERAWKADMRLRYNWVPAVTSTGFIWGLSSLLFLIVMVRRRRRQKRLLEALDAVPVPLPPGEGAEIIPFPPQPGPGHSAHRG